VYVLAMGVLGPCHSSLRDELISFHSFPGLKRPG
jgi:hypothetical protein